MRFPLQCLGTKQPWVWKHTWLGARLPEPWAGRQVGMEHPEPHRMFSLVPQHPGWSLTGWLEPRAQEVKREGREHITVVVGQADASLRPLAS